MRLNDSKSLSDYLAARDIAIFSCDIRTDDWMLITAPEIVKRTLRRLREKGRGIILFHDTESATARALPGLLR